MFDINFFMKAHSILNELEKNKTLNKPDLVEIFESFREKRPVVYNIETTNACNMKCQMCPRTKLMTRQVETIDKNTFIKIIEQITPHNESDWMKWEEFIAREYGIPQNGMGENHFFLYVIPKVLQLHGYGDPLLDKNMPFYVKVLSEKKIPSYFSCNPINIDIEKTERILERGLTYIKYSIESVDDYTHKRIRGKASDFSKSYSKILQLLDLKKVKGYGTTIVITMLDLNREKQAEEFKLLKQAFQGLDVYIYLKSEDQQWYRKDFHGTCSIHWSEFCKHPWMSMTIKSNGEVAMCMEDFNNEIILGDAKKQSLYEIWNGEKYRTFRDAHFNLNGSIKCTERCDMKMIGKLVKE